MTVPLRILVLADTHDHLPANMEALAQGADEIWHLGDVCSQTIAQLLDQIGPPLTVVRGNCDSNVEWPLVADLKRNGVRFRLVHIPPERPPESIDVVLHGHTHVPRNERRENVLFLNPGCVTRPNRGAPASVANLEITTDGKIKWQTIKLR
jgi:putative phosphoesterase